jgi:hypothetical protein
VITVGLTQLGKVRRSWPDVDTRRIGEQIELAPDGRPLPHRKNGNYSPPCEATAFTRLIRVVSIFGDARQRVCE